MPANNKAKGNAFEREFVAKCKEKGIEAKRSWGSNGKSMGEEQEVDCLITLKDIKLRVQNKKGYNQPSTKLKGFLTNVDICVWSASDKRKYPNADYVFMSLDTLLELLEKLK